jgi:hypothetical protein
MSQHRDITRPTTHTPLTGPASPGHFLAHCPGDDRSGRLQRPVRPGCGGSGLPLCPGPRGGAELDVAPAAVPPAATARRALPVCVKEDGPAVTAGALASAAGPERPAVQRKRVQDREQPSCDRQ